MLLFDSSWFDAMHRLKGCSAREYLAQCNRPSVVGIKCEDMNSLLAVRIGTEGNGCAGSPVEAVLVARATKGDRGAFEALVRQHKRSALNLARRIVCDDDAAEDVAQEALIKAYQQLHRFRGEASFSTWLYRIVINESRAHLRSDRRRRARLEQHASLEASKPEAEEFDSQTGPIMSLLAELPEKQRVALSLFYLQELSSGGIADAMGAPTGTVKAWLSRGRERLRRLASERGMV